MLPKEILSHTTDTLHHEHGKKSSLIYIVSILAILGALISLPLIKVAVTVHSTALIRPTTEITTIRSLVSGKVRESRVAENIQVKKGDVLYIIESESLTEKENHLREHIDEIKGYIDDLSKLIRSIDQESETVLLKTPLYRQSLSSYQQKRNELTTRYLKAKKDHDRNFKLHEEKVIADAEFENFTYELERTRHDLNLLKQGQLEHWQNQRNKYEIEHNDNQTQLAQLVKEKANLFITSPVAGAIQNHAGIYAGSNVFANQELAQISPDTSLIVEAYVSPNDIGFLQREMPVRFQVDAFNYNQWGLASGKIEEISNDVHVIDGKPVFRVKSSLTQNYLTLKNGYKGFLKKGMTLQARFVITQRTLWQLLYDKVDDWLNPSTFKTDLAHETR